MNQLETTTLRQLLLRRTTQLRVTIGQLQRGTLSTDAAILKLTTHANEFDEIVTCLQAEE